MTRSNIATHYFEAHVTIDPVFGVDRECAESIASRNGFKLAKLLMARNAESQLDTFMTGHGIDLEALRTRMKFVVQSLQANGFHVRRYKIEDCVLDSRIDDELRLLS